MEKGTEELSTQSVVEVEAEAPIKAGSAASQEFDESKNYQLIR